MKKIYVIGYILAIIICLYTAYLHGKEEFIPMPNYIEGYLPSSDVKTRVVYQLNSNGSYQNVLYEGESKRIIGVWQNSIETLLALGVGDRIIAAIGVPDSKYIAKDYRDEYEKIPYKSMQIPDIETTLLWEPDLLVGWYSTFQKKNWKSSDFWSHRGIHTYISTSSYKKSKRTLDGEYQYILDLGAIVNRTSRAEEIVQNIKNYVQAAKNYSITQQSKDRVMILEREGRQFRVYNEDTLAGNMVKEIGGNLIKDAGETINMEELIYFNPSVIFLIVVEEDYDRQTELVQNLYNNSTLQHVDAIRNHRIYSIPLCMIYSAGTRVKDGLDIMIQGLYPNFTGGIHE